jgi:hypothetical protein
MAAVTPEESEMNGNNDRREHYYPSIAIFVALASAWP